jgi:hypothetical protein
MSYNNKIHIPLAASTCKNNNEAGVFELTAKFDVQGQGIPMNMKIYDAHKIPYISLDLHCNTHWDLRLMLQLTCAPTEVELNIYAKGDKHSCPDPTGICVGGPKNLHWSYCEFVHSDKKITPVGVLETVWEIQDAWTGNVLMRIGINEYGHICEDETKEMLLDMMTSDSDQS